MDSKFPHHSLTPSKQAMIRTWRQRGWTCSARPWAPLWLSSLIKNVQLYYTTAISLAVLKKDVQEVLLDYSHASCQLCCLLKSFERNFCFRAPPCWCCFKRRASQALHGEEGCLHEVWDPLITSESTCVATSVSLMCSPPFQHSFRFHTVVLMPFLILVLFRQSLYDRDITVFSTDGHLF